MGRYLLFFFACLTLLWAQPPREKVSIQLQWADQFQFAGYYIAKEKGFYRDAGLDVEIRKFDPGRLSVDEVLEGRTDYGIGRSSLLVDRMKGKPVVALNAVFQSSPFVLLSAKSANIVTPRDLIGKRIMMTQDFSDTISVRAMLNSQGVKMDQLQFLKHSYDPLDIANGTTDVMACYISNEPFILKEKGIETNAISPEAYGFDFYSDILFTSEDEVKHHPKRVRAFVDASLRGWEYAFSHIDETARLIKERYNGQNKSLESLIYEGTVLKTLAYRGNQPLGAMNLEKFRRISDIYKVMGVAQSEERLVGFLYEDSALRTLPLSIEERSFLHMTPIRYTSTFSWPPFNFHKSGNKHEIQGIANDFWELIVQRSGMQASFIPSPTWSGVLNAIKTKQADVTLATSVSPGKENYAIFSKPYASFPNVIVTNKTIDFLPGLSALNGKKVAIGEGYGVAELIARYYPEIQIVAVEDTREGLKLLSAEQVDAVIDILPVVAYLINADHYVDLKISGTTEFTFDVRMMIRNDYPQLKSLIDKAIDSISEAERQKILNRYIAITYEEGVDLSWMIWIAAAASVIILFFVYRQFEMGKYNKKLLKMATTDPLTQIANRIRLDEKLAGCNHYFQRSRRPYTVIIMDLDHFKEVNDIYGHLIGDKTLVSVAALLQKSIRDTDLVGRWGGEEFMIICPETDLSGARHLAEKITKVLSVHDFEYIHALTCSFGIAQSRIGERVENIVGRADDALYRAKNEGRNRIYTE